MGDRKAIFTPSLERKSFSMLQLALHNLDPKASYTRQRLQRALYLQPAWRHRLGADYLINTIASLEIGGQYDALLNSTFYPVLTAEPDADKSDVPALLNRALHERAQLQLYTAAQQGLSACAQELFNTAMVARAPEDLARDGQSIQLCVVHLVGHTMQHDRYIAGVLVIHDQHSGHCVVYWPAAP